MAAKCPFFGKCGGCKYDFTAADYHENKMSELRGVPLTSDAIWTAPGLRRRADFAFAGGAFGFYESGTKNIIAIDSCPNLSSEINQIIPLLSSLPWGGAGSCLVTLCDNGIDIAVASTVPYVTPEFRTAAQSLPAIRITWNDKVIKQTVQPIVSFSGVSVDFPSGAFLQPTIASADKMRDLVVSRASGMGRTADLFCGLGNFTYALRADGFDVVGTGVKRDLFKNPLTIGMLNQYDCVVMDPPRAGALAQCQELARSNTKRVIYISCNPKTFMRDASVLTRGGYQMRELVPLDQFVGSHHWELFSVFDKQ